MADSSDEDDWRPRTQVGLQDLLNESSRSKVPLISQVEGASNQAAALEAVRATDAYPAAQTELSQPSPEVGAPLEPDLLDAGELSDELPDLRPAEVAVGAGQEPSFSSGQGRRSEAELVQDAEQDKAEGVGLFQSGQYFKSYQVWRRSIDALEGAGVDGEDARRVFVALCSNAAQALLKCPEVEGAATEMAASMADKALALEPNNTRALFRRGCAYANAQGWLLARKDFEQVLRMEPGNEAARRELEKMEEVLPPPSEVARKQDLPVAMVPQDPAEAVRMAQKEAERFRREILAMADKKGCVPDWCKKFNKVQVMTADWAKHQLKDPEILQDLLMLRGPLFQSMDGQQREDFLCAYDFVQEVRQRHQEEIDQLFKS